jgi:hypothetical protein
MSRLVNYKKRSVRAQLSDIEKQVSMMFDPAAAQVTLLIASADGRFAVDLGRLPDGPVFASVDVEIGSSQETVLRAFFGRHNLEFPDTSRIPVGFSPNLPITQACEISPPPLDAAAMAKLCSAFFREVGGLSDDSELCFEHYKMLQGR